MARTNGILLTINLDHAYPPIWRRVAIPWGFELDGLNLLIQLAMGWEGFHHHCFTAKGQGYGPDTHISFQLGQADESQVLVDSLLPRKGSKFKYRYGDWGHTIVCDGAASTLVPVPRVLAGQGASPPEDCGHAYQYNCILPLISAHTPEGHRARATWGIDEDFDPTAFDLEATDAKVREVWP